MSKLATQIKKDKLIGTKRPAKAGDADAARELVLFTENEAKLWGPGNTQGASIRKNLELKAQKGTLDPKKAPKLFEYLMKSAADMYGKQYGGTFDVATRRLAAEDMAETFLEELQSEAPKGFKVGNNGTFKNKSYFIIQRGNVGHTAVLYSASGKVVNSINGGPQDSEAVLERAAYKAWPFSIQRESKAPSHKGFSEPDLLDFKIKTGISKIFEAEEKLVVRKVKLNSDGYAPEKNHQYFGADRPGQLLFEIDGLSDGIIVRTPSKPVIVGMLKALGYKAR